MLLAQTLYTDCAVWGTAITGPAINDTFSADIANGDNITLTSGINTQGNGGVNGPVAIKFNEVSDGRYKVRVRNSAGTAGYLSMDWNYPSSPIDSFCAEFNSISSSRGVHIKGFLGNTQVFDFPLFAHFSNTSIGSFGIIHNVPFDRIQYIAQGTGSDDLFFIDNLSFVESNASVADLSINKSNGSDFATPGQAISWNIEVINSGPADVNNVIINDIVPAANVTNVSWTCTASGSSSCVTGGGVSSVVNETINIAAGAVNKINIQVTGTLTNVETGAVSNTASITVPALTADPDTSNNASTDTDKLGLFIDSFEDISS